MFIMAFGYCTKQTANRNENKNRIEIHSNVESVNNTEVLLNGMITLDNGIKNIKATVNEAIYKIEPSEAISDKEVSEPIAEDTYTETNNIVDNETVSVIQYDNEPLEISGSYAGTFSITAYTWTGNAMANGEYPYYGSVASSDFPLGTTLYIEGVGTFVVNDVCPTSGVIDMYMDNYDACINFGRISADVYVQ